MELVLAVVEDASPSRLDTRAIEQIYERDGQPGSGAGRP